MSVAPLNEDEEAEKQQSSYRYWVRERTEQAAPDPVPRKLSSSEAASAALQPGPLGSVWNQAGTWEEKCVSKWATDRIQELLLTVKPLEFEKGFAKITDIPSCMGEATLVTVRNKKRFGYSYEITMKFKGSWMDFKDVEGTLKVPEASYSDLEDLQLEVALSDGNSVPDSEKTDFMQALKSFLPAIREKLQEFEDELKAH